MYTPDVTVFIGPSVCSKTGRDLVSVCLARTKCLLTLNVVQKSTCLNWLEQHISSPTHSKRLYLSFTQSRHVLLETVLDSDTSQNDSPAKSPAQIPTGKFEKRIRQLKSRIKSPAVPGHCGGGDKVKTRHLSITVLPLFPHYSRSHRGGFASDYCISLSGKRNAAIIIFTILICRGPGSNPRPQVPPGADSAD